MSEKNKSKSRRSFIHQASGAMGAVAVTAAGWPLIDQMNPSKDVEALAKIEIDISRRLYSLSLLSSIRASLSLQSLLFETLAQVFV